jgi:hypothetical protein
LIGDLRETMKSSKVRTKAVTTHFIERDLIEVADSYRKCCQADAAGNAKRIEVYEIADPFGKRGQAWGSRVIAEIQIILLYRNIINLLRTQIQALAVRKIEILKGPKVADPFGKRGQAWGGPLDRLIFRKIIFNFPKNELVQGCCFWIQLDPKDD